MAAAQAPSPDVLFRTHPKIDENTEIGVSPTLKFQFTQTLEWES